MSTIQTLYIDNDTILDLDGLKNELTGAFVNDATVTVTLTNSAGVAVGGEVWPKTLAYVAGSEGSYRATLPDTLSLTNGGRYEAAITADAGAGLRASWVIACVARTRN